MLIPAILAAMLLPGNVVSAEPDNLLSDTDEATRVLTLQECMEIAQVGNIGLKRARLGIEAGLLDRIRAESAFDPGFELDLSGRHTDSDSATFGGSSTTYDFATRYRLPTWDGSTWVLSFGQSRTSTSTSNGEGPGTYRSYGTQLGIGYAVPLLEGRGEWLNRLAVVRAGLSVSRSEAAVNEAARSLRYAIIQAYISAVLAARSIEVAELSLETAENLVEEVQARIDVGQLAAYELLAAQAGLAERRENLLNAASGLATALDTLKDLVGLPIDEEIAIDPDTIGIVSLYIDADELFVLAQRFRPDLRDIALRLEQAQLDMLLADDRRQASLLWNTTLGLSGQGANYGDSVDDLGHFSWFTGIQYRLPLGGNRAAEAGFASAHLAIEQLQLERVDFLRKLLREIRAAAESYENALLRIDVTAQGLEVQEVKMESERLRLELGLITSRDMLEFDLEYAGAVLAHDQAYADAMLAVARLEYLVNQTLLDRAGLKVEAPSETEEVE